MTTVVLSAGGTGGHLFPAQALAAELIRRQRSVVLMTDARGRNYEQAFPGTSIATVPSASPSNTNAAGRVLVPLRILAGVVSGFLKLSKQKPAAVVGFGGYPSLPVMIAAWLAGLPTIIHEQNAILGRVNRLLATRMHAIAASFPFARFAPKEVQRVQFTGNPVRPEAVALAHAPYHSPAGDDPIRILVFGGSQGAKVFGDTVPAAMALLPNNVRVRLEIVQQSRPEDQGAVRSSYTAAGIFAEVQPFFNDLPQRMAAAHLVICRSGASTVSELAVIGRPSILVPYPFATDDHQTANATVLTKAGAAWLVRQRDLTPQMLSMLLAEILANPNELARRAEAAASLGRPDAAQRLADLVDELCAGAA
ncbi:MAG: undecaprenyldiphospho-muramoylpentapeptide beta-N-acetylglucosaminyltransferase [Alphaproteobacteria bacterium]|nr:undecaprenyldiphospho-muramoylpentapeptide beta-N-acetylglucosaminyltransferase [Alphaproteobacteria bacterium]